MPCLGVGGMGLKVISKRKRDIILANGLWWLINANLIVGTIYLILSLVLP